MKHIIITFLTFCTLLLTGCVFDNPKYLNFQTKPNNYYYSNEIYKKLKNHEDITLKVFDSDLYRYYDVSENDNDIMISFFESLKTENYLDDSTLKTNPRYELSIQFDDEKFIINVYSKDLITIYPWDGSFKEDIISMSSVSPKNNIYDFCTYVINKSHQN